MRPDPERARELRRQQTDPEAYVWSQLRNRRFHQFKFRRQVPIGAFIADFVCVESRLIVEIDGGQHTRQRGYDRSRTEFLEREGYRVIRFWNCDIQDDWDTVAEAIWTALQQSEK